MTERTLDRRIRPPRAYSAVFNVLTDNEQIFETIAECLVFAAAVGYNYKKRIPIDTFGEGIRISVFDNQRYAAAIMDTLAFSESESSDIFKRENSDGWATIFEEYANGGLQIIKETIIDAPGDNLSLILSLIQKVQRPDKETEEDMLKDFDLGF